MFVSVHRLSLPVPSQVEGELGSVILDDSFVAKLTQSKGRQIMDSSLNPDREAKENGDLPTSPSQAAL